MTQITVNNRTLSEDRDMELSVADLVGQLMVEDDDIITSIYLDGQKIEGAGSDEFFLRQVSCYETIDLTIRTRTELVLDALESCSGYVDILIDSISNLVLLYSENQRAEANAKFGEIIEVTDLFVKLMSQIKNTIRNNYPNRIPSLQKLQPIELHLTSVLKNLIPAKEKEDIIMLCDLLEYELVDNLTQWKTIAIPELKKIREV